MSLHSTNHNTFLMNFSGISLRFKKIDPMFSSFNPCLLLPSVAIDDRKQFQCLNIASHVNNKTGQFFFGIQ